MKTYEALSDLGMFLTDIPSAARFPDVSGAKIVPAFFTETDVRDWASLEANLSEGYSRGSLPAVSSFAGHGASAPFVGLNAVAAQLSELDRTFSVSFPESLREYEKTDGFRAWLARRLDDPGFYHFVIQFGVSTDPDFVAFLYWVWRGNESRILECLRGRPVSPAGLYLPADFSASARPNLHSAFTHFCTYEGFALGERMYDLQIYKLRARHGHSVPDRIITHSGPFPLDFKRLEMLLGYAVEMLPSAGRVVFYLPVFNESLRRLNSTLGWFMTSTDIALTPDAATAQVSRAVESLNHAPSLVGLSTLSVHKAKPLVAGAWGTVGVCFSVDKKTPARREFRRIPTHTPAFAPRPV